MVKQDKTGTKYEKLIATCLRDLGYEFEASSGRNYLHPRPNSKLVIPETFIQPDLVVRCDERIIAIIYATHWSNKRNCNFKFWRTWEEETQQKIILGDSLLSINCIFEALPVNSQPASYITSNDLTTDKSRDDSTPIGFNGWYSAVSWAMVEAFDITIAFPSGYQPVHAITTGIIPASDSVTSELLKNALNGSSKLYFSTQWEILRKIRENHSFSSTIKETRSRYRIGLLHIYLFYGLLRKLQGRPIGIQDFVKALVNSEAKEPNQISLGSLAKTPAFKDVEFEKLHDIFKSLSKVYVRKGKKKKGKKKGDSSPETYCSLNHISNPEQTATIVRISFNDDLQTCLQSLKSHIDEVGFVSAIERAFNRFDLIEEIDEVFDNLANPKLVEDKAKFAKKLFAANLEDEEQLNEMLQAHAKQMSSERLDVSAHTQGWVLEMLLYVAGLNSDEDIQTRVKLNFEASGHNLRPHAPYGDDAKVVRFLLQGKDICEQWSSSKRKKQTLGKDDFRELCWQSVAKCVVQSFQEGSRLTRPLDAVIVKYQSNKSMRIIGADLNGFSIIIEHYLSDICFLQFIEDSIENKAELKQRICNSWQTDVVNKLWDGRPLETWMDGVSKNGQWLIKVQSSQDGNEGHKTKELAGRCRALRIAWSHGEDPRNRDEWQFTQRKLPKLALVLDGDWDSTKKRNLYEAGWDWVGDVSQLHELRELIGADD